MRWKSLSGASGASRVPRSSGSAWGRQIEGGEPCESVCSVGPALITALLPRELPGGTFAGVESGVFLLIIDLTKALHALVSQFQV